MLSFNVLSLNGFDRADRRAAQNQGIAIGPAATQALALRLLPPPTDATPCLRHMSMIEGGFLVIEDYVCLIASCKSTQYYYSKNIFWVQYAKRNKIELPEGCVSAYPVVKEHRLRQTDKLKGCLSQFLFTGTYPRLIYFIDHNKQDLDPVKFLPEFFEIAKDIIKSKKKLSSVDTVQLISLTADIPNRSKYMELFSMLDLSILEEYEYAFLLNKVLRPNFQFDNPNFEVAKALIRARPSLISSDLVESCIKHKFIELIEVIVKIAPPFLFRHQKIATLALECCYPDIVVNYMCANIVTMEKQEEILEHACIRGYDEIVKIALNKGWPINGRFAAIALRHSSMDIFDMFMRQKIDDPNVHDEIYCMAAFMGRLDIIKQCRSLGWTLTLETRNQCAYEASKWGHIDVVKYFLPINKTYRTLSLYEAARRDDLEMIECLRPELLDPERRADVLAGALGNGNSEIIERILKSGPYAVTENNRSRIINAASEYHRIDIVTFCDPKKLSGKERYEAIDIARKYEDLEMMNILLESGTIGNSFQHQLIKVACQFSSAAIIQMLLRYDPIRKEPSYRYAALNGRVDLLDGLNIEMSDKDRAHLLSLVVNPIKRVLQSREVYKKVESGGPICWRSLIYHLSFVIDFKTFFEVFSSVPLKEIPNLNDHIDYIRKNSRSLIGINEHLNAEDIASLEAEIEISLKRLTELEQLAH